MSKKLLISFLIFLFSLSAYGYNLKPLSSVFENDKITPDEAFKVLIRCNAWNNMIANMAQQSNEKDLYEKSFNHSLFFYNTAVDFLIDEGKRESDAEKYVQDNLFQLDEKYMADGKINVKKYGVWFEGYFKGHLGDANICDKYYEMLQ